MTEDQNSETQTEEPVHVSWRKFLETYPPMRLATISDFGRPYGAATVINTPPIMLFCENEDCGKEQFFDTAENNYWKDSGFFLIYTCRHCRNSQKFFAIMGEAENSLGIAIKVGEVPTFGPPIPNRLLRLFGSDSHIFLKGRQCENQGLGVGAFAYYRRVVENHKNQLIQEIQKVASRLGTDDTTTSLFEAAKKETSFQKAMSDIKDAVPRELMLHGQNPLLLLHSALSHGLHDGTDEGCLELAQDIRTVLTELTERISSILRDEEGLKSAVSRLLSRQKSTKVKEL